MTSPINCTGIAIQRDVILTAGHCACAMTASAQTFANAFFWREGNSSGERIEAKSDGIHVLDCGYPGGNGNDLAVIELERAATLAELRDVLPVLTESVPVSMGALPFVQPPILASGWAGNGGFGLLSVASLENPALWSGVVYFLRPPSSNEGDSGGPVTYWDGQQQRVFGVLSHRWSNTDGQAGTGFAPTFSYPGSDHGGFIAQFIDDEDDDGFRPNFDNCPHDWNPAQTDSDSDGLGDECDPCPWSADHRDHDGDGAIDGCESDDQCPCDPVNDPNLPQDHDGVCGYCDGRLGGSGSFCEAFCNGAELVQRDNCPAVDNPDQRNCNADAESAREARALGDACDPVPCPAFVPDHSGAVVQTYYLPGPAGAWMDTVKWTELSGIGLSPVGAHKILGGPKTAFSSPTEERGVTADTEYRACVNVPALNVRCNELDAIGNHFITDTENVAAERRNSVWHRVTFDGMTAPGTSADGSDWNPLAPLYYHTTAEGVKSWDWTADYGWWSKAWGEAFFPAHASEPGQGAGRFWTHGRTNIGEQDDPFGFGTHPVNPTDSSGMDAEDYSRLVNHYEPFEPVTKQTSREYWGFPTLPLQPLRVFECPDCPVYGSLTPSNDCITCGPFGAVQFSRPGDAELVLVLPRESGVDAGVLRADGKLQLVNDRLGARLLATLASDAVVLSAVEPNTSVGGGARNPAGIALSPDGTSVVDRIYQGAGGFLSQHDMEVIAEDNVASARTVSADALATLSPAPRTGFEAVYSRSSARVFVVGGTDSATNAPSGDIWWHDATGSGWTRVPLQGYAPERVMAATYSYRDHRLWVLDEKKQGAVTFARLVRIDPVNGHHALIGAWPRLRLAGNWIFDRHWLVIDRDGGVLLAASSSKLNKHVIVRIDVSAAPRIDGVRVAPFSFAAAPAADANGYALVLERRNKAPKLVRLKTLEARPGRWLDLGACL